MIGQSSQEAPHENVTDSRAGSAKDDSADAAPTPAATGTITPESTRREFPKEWGGREGPEPTRYGDWEKNGRCIDF